MFVFWIFFYKGIFVFVVGVKEGEWVGIDFYRKGNYNDLFFIGISYFFIFLNVKEELVRFLDKGVVMMLEERSWGRVSGKV